MEKSSSFSFFSAVYSEIEETGWEHLVSSSPDLSFLSFRLMDRKGRTHVLEIQLDHVTYPKYPPSLSADVPYMLNVKWLPNSRLKDLLQQFRAHLEKLQEFWSVMDNIDSSLCVIDPRQPSRAMSSRQIDLGNDCVLMLFIDAKDPSSLPESGCEHFEKVMAKKWQTMKDRLFTDNLSSILENELPRLPNVQKDEQNVECGICYAQYLPLDDELGCRSGTGTDYICDNNSCSRSFHSVCLVDWLRSITTTRQSFNVLFGHCPYCSDPIAVKIDNAKQ